MRNFWRYFQCSIRTALFAFTVACIAIGLILHSPLVSDRAETKLRSKGICVESYSSSGEPIGRDISPILRYWGRTHAIIGFDKTRCLPLDCGQDLASLDCSLRIGLCAHVTTGRLSSSSRPRGKFAEVSDNDVEELLKCRNNIISLSLCGPKITDRSLNAVAKMPNLQSFGLSKANVTDEGLALLKNLKHLKHIDLSDTGVTWGFVMTGGDFCSLDSLSISFATIDPQIGSRLANCKHLKNLQLLSCDLESETIASLREISTLKNLTLWGATLDDDAVKAICKLTQIDTLDLSNSELDDDRAKYLMGLPRLRWLGISGTGISQDMADGLALKVEQLDY